MTFSTAIPPVPEQMGDWYPWNTFLARTVNTILRGKMNIITNLTLSVSVASTTFKDSRIGANSFIGFMPTTANAAAEIGNGTMFVGAQQSGQATITHANNVQADRTYRVVILG